MKTTRISISRFTGIALGLSASLLGTGCASSASGTGVATTATMAFGTYTAMSTPQRVMSSLFAFVDSLIAQSATAATSNITLCIRRIRFKSPNETESSDPTVDPDNDDVSKDNRVGQGGYLAVGSTGVFGTVSVPRPKVATRVRIDVDNHCVGHPAASFITAAGSFSTNSGFTLEFRSSSQVDLTKNATVTLNWQAINTALNNLSSGASDSTITGALSTQGSM